MADQLTFDVAVPSWPVDADRAALLDIIDGHRAYRNDRREIVDAIFWAARKHHGRIDPNVVRAKLTDPEQSDLLTVNPRVVGAVYHALASKGVIAADGWTPSTDRAGGNYGKPSRLYRWVGAT